MVLQPRPASNPRIYYNVLSRNAAANIAEVFGEVGDYDAGADHAGCSTGCASEFAEYPGARISVHQFENGPPVVAPIEIRVIGPDIETLRLLAGEVERLIVRRCPARATWSTRCACSAPTSTSHRHREGRAASACRRSRPTARCASRSRASPPARFREPDGDEYDITLRLPIEGAADARPAATSIQVSSATGAQVPLAQITDPQFTTAAPLIKRYNRERAVTVTRLARDRPCDRRADARGPAPASTRSTWPPGYR